QEALDVVGELKSAVGSSKLASDKKQAIVAGLETYATAFTNLVAQDQKIEGDMVAMVNSARQLEELVQSTYAGAVSGMQVSSEQNANQAQRSLVLPMSISLLAILFGLGAAIYVSGMIAKPLVRLSEIASGVAEGNIDQTIDHRSKDETGILADAFRKLMDYMKELSVAAGQIASKNLSVQIAPKSSRDVLGISFKTMCENFNQVISELRNNTGKLTSAASEISSSSEQMSKGAQEQSDQISQISVAIEEMAATIVESSKNAGEATDASRKASETAGCGGEVVSETIQGMQRIAEVVTTSSGCIEKLAGSADQIGEIISVIDDIADQTNLLALNAAIEAARAGEQGRGFAVVADEVRKLAERTGKATGEITEMIKGIQQETVDAVQSMQTGIDEVGRGRKLADQAGDNLNEILQVSQRVMEMVQHMATASEEQSVAAGQISKNVEQISQVTKETASGAVQSASAAEQLHKQADILKGMVDQFTTR
ncbi:MAG TPA: methyl-accepting chemotaxis protein, partial [candidate division Zixibacteria bacterium]|nr:methyl-accepting chemotaxis protein [candidate division Zixibacteria bacterium]